MATKTFKIGESCVGGIITAIANDKSIQIQGKEWDYAKGSNRGSDQSNAKIFCSLTLRTDEGDIYRKLYNYLTEMTTHYYTEMIIDWIETKTKLTQKGLW